MQNRGQLYLLLLLLFSSGVVYLNIKINRPSLLDEKETWIESPGPVGHERAPRGGDTPCAAVRQTLRFRTLRASAPACALMREGHGVECDLLGDRAFDSDRCAVRVASEKIFTGRADKCRVPPPAPPEPAFGTCALVSSSGALLGSGCGGEIDAQEAVWRMNSPVVAGFEQDVGARTDFNVMMSWPARIVVGPEAKGYEEAAAVSWAIPGSRFPSVPHSSPPRPLDLLNATAVCSGGCSSICGKLMCANASRWNARGFQCANNLFNQVLADFRRALPSKWSRSTGLRTTFLAGAMCSELNLYGFRELLPHQPYHYWEPVVQNESSPDVQARKNHHMDFEHALLDSLSRLPAIPLCRTLDPSRPKA